MRDTLGFTIVELLIVIAIIAILASVVLPRMNNARLQGEGARIMSELENFYKAALSEELHAGNFDIVCGTNGESMSSDLLPLWNSLSFRSSQVVCNSTADDFAVSAELDPNHHWCVDSVGVKKEITSALASDVTACP